MKKKFFFKLSISQKCFTRIALLHSECHIIIHFSFLSVFPVILRKLWILFSFFYFSSLERKWVWGIFWHRCFSSAAKLERVVFKSWKKERKKERNKERKSWKSVNNNSTWISASALSRPLPIRSRSLSENERKKERNRNKDVNKDKLVYLSTKSSAEMSLKW